MGIEQYTYWSVTINNPDENDWVIILNPNWKYIKQCVHTLEKGEEGTVHIQAWVRLQRNQAMSFVKKLYPRAHLKHCDKDVHNENVYRYAQKNDGTTVGNHVNTINDPLPAVDSQLYKVLERVYEAYDTTSIDREYEDGDWKEEYTLAQYRIRSFEWKVVERWSHVIEEDMVTERANLEKLFVSATYEKIKQRFWKSILVRIIHNQNGRQDERLESCSEGSKEEEDFCDAVSDGGTRET